MRAGLSGKVFEKHLQGQHKATVIAMADACFVIKESL